MVLGGGGRSHHETQNLAKCPWLHNNNTAVITQISQFNKALFMTKTYGFNSKEKIRQTWVSEWFPYTLEGNLDYKTLKLVMTEKILKLKVNRAICYSFIKILLIKFYVYSSPRNDTQHNTWAAFINLEWLH